MNAIRLSALLVAALPLAYTACGGDNLTLPSEGEPAHIVVTAGSPQSGRVGAQLAAPLVVKVTDTQDRPVAGATVNFTFDDAAAGGSAQPESKTTDANGEASSNITLGPRVGPMSGHATVPVPQGTVPVTVPFTVTALSADADGIAAVSGNDQTAPVGTALGAPLVVRVTDEFGNPIPDVTVSWTAVGGGSVSAATRQTDASGQASVTRTLGNTAGDDQTTEASSAGLAGSPVIFTHHAVAGNASRVEIVSGNGQNAPAGTQLSADFVVRVLDGQDNPIANRAVTWIVSDGGGTVAPENSSTNAEGRASTRLTLGSTPGNNTVNAVVSGVGNATFTATGTGAGSPSRLAIITQPSDVTVGATITPAPVVQVRDAAGHDVAVAGVEITAAIFSGSGSLQGTLTVSSDASGRATFSDLRIVGGTGSHRLIFAADLGSVRSNNFNVNATPNLAPVVLADDYSTSEDTPLTVPAPGVLSNDSDPEGGPLTAVNASNSPNGSVDLHADGSFTYTPDPNFNGDDSFTYRARDNAGNETSGTGTIHVAAVNDAPSFTMPGAGTTLTPPTNQPILIPDWASPSAGPANESGQSLNFLVDVGPGVTFSDPPAITRNDITGRWDLTFTASTQGNALVTVRVHDSGGGDDTSPAQTFNIQASTAGASPPAP